MTWHLIHLYDGDLNLRVWIQAHTLRQARVIAIVRVSALMVDSYRVATPPTHFIR